MNCCISQIPSEWVVWPRDLKVSQGRWHGTSQPSSYILYYVISKVTFLWSIILSYQINTKVGGMEPASLHLIQHHIYVNVKINFKSSFVLLRLSFKISVSLSTDWGIIPFFAIILFWKLLFFLDIGHFHTRSQRMACNNRQTFRK